MTSRYQIQCGCGTSLEVEGELSEWKGKRVILDGLGRPWLLISDADVVMQDGVTVSPDSEVEDHSRA
jgi:hypothetical protein